MFLGWPMQEQVATMAIRGVMTVKFGIGTRCPTGLLAQAAKQRPVAWRRMFEQVASRAKRYGIPTRPWTIADLQVSVFANCAWV